MQNHPYDIAIIGGGLSGALTAINLMRTATAPFNMLLIEKNADGLLRGVAFHSSARYLPLNVPVKKMSLISADHHNFEKWLEANKDKYADAVPDASPDAFVSRGVYGHYIQDTFLETFSNLPKGVNVDEHINEVVAIDAPDADGYCTLHMADGNITSAKKVVIALGNFPPVNVPLADQTFFNTSKYYLPSAWDFKAIENIGKDEDVLVIGTGLSMLDVLLTLNRIGHQGHISTISLQGLLPRAHAPALELPITIDTDGLTALKLFTTIRQEIRIAEEQGHNWRTVLDSIRTQTPAIWKALPLTEKQHFMRHLRHHWDVHRHRIPQSSQDVVDKLTEEGHFNVYAGKMVSLVENGGKVEVTYKQRGNGNKTIIVDKVINCTGPHPDFTRVPSALVKQLLATGQAKVDEMKIGFEAADDYAMIKADGSPSKYLYLIGPMLKASWWESVALREIRQQAEALPKVLLA